MALSKSDVAASLESSSAFPVSRTSKVRSSWDTLKERAESLKIAIKVARQTDKRGMDNPELIPGSPQRKANPINLRNRSR